MNSAFASLEIWSVYALTRSLLPILSHKTVVHGYVWRYVKKLGARILFRGVRSWDKDGAEERHLQILNTWGPLVCGPLVWPIPTWFLEGKPVYNHVSSTLIREISSPDLIKELVPESIADNVVRFYHVSRDD